MVRHIYLDYNATVPVIKQVKEALIDCLNLGPLNASSVHYYGRVGKNIVEEAKLNISKSINAQNNNVIFTSSASH